MRNVRGGWSGEASTHWNAYPFLYRYPPQTTDGFAGWEGALLPGSFWAVTAQALTGDPPGAVVRMDAL